MIERYTRPEMGAIWSEEGKYRRWLDVEIAVCEVLAERGVIPSEAVREIREKAAVDPWKQDYRYKYPGARNPNGYDIWSIGADGKDGTDDDVTNWEEE